MAVDPARWRRLEEVCQAALERPSQERAAFLHEACGDDEGLRRDAESLLEREAKAGGFLSTPLAALAADAVTYSPGGTPLQAPSTDLVGRRIGAYELLGKLGAGGMGVVYRAHDHSLGRSVAIKVLPEDFAADRDRLARFEREARLLASLSHPNIAAIYGVERSETVTALVLELVDGQTLEARLVRGPMPIAQALEVSVQIAFALDHAHRHGVAHRDLKPANVMLTKHGVKLLDFGLAKWSERPAGYVAASNAVRPEGAGSLTAEGTILGTLHYMAPEQLEGKAVDARADIFAFGAVLYEMLAGRKAFDGGSGAAIMAAVLDTEPPGLETAQPLAPRALDRVVRKCLAKDPDDRWQSARDLADELRWIAAGSTQAPAGTTAAAVPTVALRPYRPWRWAAAATAVALVAATLAWVGGSRSGGRAASVPLVTRFVVQPTVAATLSAFAVSPDGREIAFTGSQQTGREPLLFVRRLDELQEIPVAGTEGAFVPFYSPDGQWIGFGAGRRLLKVNLRAGTAPVSLCDCEPGLLNGVAWLENGSIVFARADSALQRIAAEGGEPSALTALAANEFDHHNPAPLPGGRSLLFTSHRKDGTFAIEAVTIDGGARTVIVESAYDAHYLSSGHLIYGRPGAILAVPFDAGRLSPTAAAVTLVEGVSGDASSGRGGFQLSANGSLIFSTAPSPEGRVLTWVTRDGRESPLPLSPRAFSSPKVSPDGTRLAFAVAEGGRRDIWIYEVSSQRLVRLTREGDNKTPLWSRSGRRLVYSSTRDGGPKLWVQPADGSAAPQAMVTGEDIIVPGSWSPDDEAIVFVHENNNSAAGSRVAVVAASGGGEPRQLFPDTTRAPAVSPDGRWIAFSGTDSSAMEVNVAAFPRPGVRHQVSVGGGRQPLWRRDGRELVYRLGPRMFAVAVDLSGGFRSSAPVLLFERPYAVGDRDVMGLDYDLAPDGRFLMIKPGPAELRTNSVNVVVNWIEEVRQRVRPGP